MPAAEQPKPKKYNRKKQNNEKDLFRQVLFSRQKFTAAPRRRIKYRVGGYVNMIICIKPPAPVRFILRLFVKNRA